MKRNRDERTGDEPAINGLRAFWLGDLPNFGRLTCNETGASWNRRKSGLYEVDSSHYHHYSENDDSRPLYDVSKNDPRPPLSMGVSTADEVPFRV